MEKKVTDCDLVVLGAGGSGLVAAVKAEEVSGKKVVILEKAKKAGGSTYYAHGFGVQYSKWQQEAGYPDTRDDTFRRTMNNLKWKPNHKLILNFVYSSGPFFDWLVEKGGAEEYFVKPATYQPSTSSQGAGSMAAGGGMMRMGSIDFPKRHMNKESRDPSIGPGWMGSYVVTKMLEQCRKIGIEILTGTRATEFITDSKGNVTGVKVDRADGKLQVNCRACVAAAGGFGANKEKLAKRWPEYADGNRFHIFSCPTKIGADPKTLAAAINRYNEFCANKRDLDFVKKPDYLIPIRKGPFYVFHGQRFTETTHGGITINENMEVLNTKGKVMPDLFAAGDNAGGHTIDGAGAGALDFAVVSGYMAGISARKYLSKA